jgi:hypothetical protein
VFVHLPTAIQISQVVDFWLNAEVLENFQELVHEVLGIIGGSFSGRGHVAEGFPEVLGEFGGIEVVGNGVEGVIIIYAVQKFDRLPGLFQRPINDVVNDYATQGANMDAPGGGLGVVDYLWPGSFSSDFISPKHDDFYERQGSTTELLSGETPLDSLGLGAPDRPPLIHYPQCFPDPDPKDYSSSVFLRMGIAYGYSGVSLNENF